MSFQTILDAARIAAVFIMLAFLWLAFSWSQSDAKKCASIYYPIVNDSFSCLAKGDWPKVLCEPKGSLAGVDWSNQTGWEEFVNAS